MRAMKMAWQELNERGESVSLDRQYSADNLINILNREQLILVALESLQHDSYWAEDIRYCTMRKLLVNEYVKSYDDLIVALRSYFNNSFVSTSWRAAARHGNEQGYIQVFDIGRMPTEKELRNEPNP